MISPIEFKDEEYKEITQDMVNGIEIGRYLISNYGTVIDTIKNRQISQISDKPGYLSVQLRLQNGNQIRVLLHRLVAMAFINGDRSLQVNHIDGVKVNEYYKNLEWVTARENLIHAIENGLNYRGEDKPNAQLLNEQVKNICKLLEDGFDYNFIVDKLMLQDIPNIHDKLHDIKCGKSWTFISKNYNIPKYKIVNDRMLSNDQVKIICKALENNINISNSELFLLANIDVSTPEKYNKMRHCIESIKKRKAYCDISNNYIW